MWLWCYANALAIVDFGRFPLHRHRQRLHLLHVNLLHVDLLLLLYG